jgi:hypothetical protein
MTQAEPRPAGVVEPLPRPQTRGVGSPAPHGADADSRLLRPGEGRQANAADIVDEILGATNEQENAVEFLHDVFGITTDELTGMDCADEDMRSRAHEAWSREKRRPENISEDCFRILVENDVNSYLSILRLRREQRPQGPNYGYKIWYLSRMARPDDLTPWHHKSCSDVT